MDKKISETVGLLRHRIISPVLMESGRSQMAYFKSIANQEFDVPGSGLRKFKPSTMKAWLNRYRKHGFNGIIPKHRSDRGTHRRLLPDAWEEIESIRKKNLTMSVVRFYEICLSKGLLGMPPICHATLRLFLRQKGLFEESTPKPRKRFEVGRFSELWTGDFMHGPLVLCGKRRKKAILFAIIDDYSRMIVGSAFSLTENTLPLELVFKQAITAFGIPDRLYVDNGPSFSSEYLAKACARIGVGLVHSKPYDSPSRGKIERFFRTVREDFLSALRPDQEITLDDLNMAFSAWLRDRYHHAMHRGINGRPIDRYQSSIMEYPPKRMDNDVLSEYFMVSFERSVNRDSTISYQNIIYEVPSRYIGKRIEIRHTQEEPINLFVYEDDQRVCRIQKVDVKENARIYRPSPENHVVSFSGRKLS